MAMRNMLFLAHRFPYPPNKGERIRAWNLLQHFSRSWNVYFGCLSDDPDDARHLDTVRPFCAELASFPIDKRTQKLKALAGLRPGRPLMLDYYRHAGLQRWADGVLARQPIDLVYIFSTPMATYVEAGGDRAVVLDMVDVDSQKWREYAHGAGWPMRHVWAREARTLLAFERRTAAACAATLLVSDPECRELAGLAPEVANRLHAIELGVDLDFFAPGLDLPTPYSGAAPQLAFVGNMDYWPNADAAIWFAREVMPLLRQRADSPEFNVVGANPGPKVLALAGLPGVRVTGRVPMTSFRAHPVDLAVMAWGSALTTGIMAWLFHRFIDSSVGVYTFLGLHVLFWIGNLIGNLRHWQVWLSYGDKLNYWLISPAHHQLHHSAEERHLGCNRGFEIAIWDRLYGTLRVPSNQPETFKMGLGDGTDGQWNSMARLYFWPFQLAFKRLFDKNVHRPKV